VIILNKDGIADLEVELDFGRGVSGAVETEILHAPALDGPRSAHHNLKENRLAQAGQVFRHYSRATGLRLTLT
jgi:hypothetical protein